MELKKGITNHTLLNEKGNEKMNIVALIITYNPDERLFQSLDKLLGLLNKVVIVDNCSNSKVFINELKNKFNGNFLTILELSKNLGIAGGMNHGVEFIKNTFCVDYILTLDQDTILLTDNLFKIIEEANQIYDSIGILALGTHRINNKSNYIETNYVISSGNLVDINIFNELKFREEFFMDQVDFDFDFEVRKRGYKIIIANDNLIDHRLGLKEGKLNYEPQFRVYYIIRNSTVLLMEGKLPIFNYLRQIINISRSATLHDGIFKHARTLIAGISDAFSRKLGENMSLLGK